MNCFYGVLLILLGILLLVRYLFKIKIPILFISVAIILVFVGVSFFINSPGTGSENNIVFSKNKTISSVKPGSEYSFVFGSGTIDLTKAHPQKAEDKIKINSVFSNGVIKVNPQTPLIVRTHSLFSVTETPNNDLIYLGNTNYQSKNFKKDAKYIEVEAKVLFGRLVIEEDSKPSSIKK